jgi:O-antigen/teichoic acid export membrane protein
MKIPELYSKLKQNRFVARFLGSRLEIRLIKGIVWSLLGTLFSRGSVLLSMIFVARILGQKGFGEFGVLRSTVDMFGIFAGFGIGLTATKYISEFKENDLKKAGQIVGLSTVISLVLGLGIVVALFLGSQFIAENVLNAPHLSSVLRIGAVLVLLNSVAGTQIGILAGLEAFKIISRINIISSFFTLPLMIAGTYRWGLYGALYGQIAGMAVKMTLIIPAVVIECKKSGIIADFRKLTGGLSVLFRYSAPALLSTMLVAPANWVCNTILVRQQNGFAEMGILSAASQWLSLLIVLPGLVSQVSVPILSSELAKKNYDGIKKIVYLSFKIILIVVTPLIVVGSIFSKNLMLIYGGSFGAGWIVMIFSLFTAGVMAMISPVGAIINAFGKMWSGFALNIGWASVFIGLTWFLGRHFGAVGVAGSRLFAYSLHFIWTSFYIVFFLRKQMRNGSIE